MHQFIAAINEGKLTLPNDQIMVLVEKKSKLEAAKKQAEKINAGVKANEEKRNAKEIKETNKKINEASKQKKYGDMNVEEAKKELKAIAGNDEEIKERFYKDLEFGTAGLRGIIGMGTNRMNKYTVTKATPFSCPPFFII
jgi:arginine/lysine/ornithine decarboxylase